MILCFMIISVCGCSLDNTKKQTISQKELLADAEFIELTTENWKDYIELKEIEVTVEDSFGEETDRYTTTRIALKENCYVTSDSVIRLTYTYDNGIGEYFERTDDIELANLGSGYDINNIFEYGVTCEKVKGSILKIDIPDEMWGYEYDINITTDEGDEITIDKGRNTYNPTVRIKK